MNLMTSGATYNDASFATTGLIGVNECEQIADMMESAENQTVSAYVFCGCITFHMEVFLHCDCIIPDDGYNIKQTQGDLCKSGDGLSQWGCLGVLGLEVHIVDP